MSFKMEICMKNSKLCITLMVILLVPAITLPMGARFAAMGKQFAAKGKQFNAGVKQGVSKLGATLQKNALLTSTATSLAILKITDNMKKKEVSHLPDASPAVQKFAHESLKPLGFVDFSSLSIKVDPKKKAGHARATPHAIILGDTDLLDADLADADADLAYYRKFFDNNTLVTREFTQRMLIARGTIQHEGGHIKYYHSHRNCVFLIPALYFGLKTQPAAYVLSLLLMRVYANYAERQADDSIEDDPETLQAQADDFKNEAVFYFSDHTLLGQLLDPHPHPLKRAQKFEERIAQLKASTFAKPFDKDSGVNALRNQGGACPERSEGADTAKEKEQK